MAAKQQRGSGQQRQPPAPAAVDQWLGPVYLEEPTTQELVAAREPGANTKAAPEDSVQAYLRAQPLVERAVAAGVAELARLRAPEHGGDAAALSAAELNDRAGVLALAVPRLRAAAATRDDAAPFPENHQVLAEGGDRWRLTLFRRGADCFVGLFARDPGQPRLLSCELEGERLPAVAGAPGETTVKLGLPRALGGKRLVVRLQSSAGARSLVFGVILEREGR